MIGIRDAMNLSRRGACLHAPAIHAGAEKPMGGPLGQFKEFHGIPERITLQTCSTQDRILEGDGDGGLIRP
jgi:hypothetical protein